jgi:hypothetical protein
MLGPSLDLLGHRKDVVACHLAFQLGMRVCDMLLDLKHKRVFVLGSNLCSALAIDEVSHANPPVSGP